MPQTPQLTIKIEDGNSVLSQVQALSGESLTKLDVSLLAETADQDVAFALDVSQLAALVMLADGAATVVTRSAVPADVDTITLAANVPLVWQATGGIALASLFTEDVAALHCDVAGASAVRLQIWALFDATT